MGVGTQLAVALVAASVVAPMGPSADASLAVAASAAVALAFAASRRPVARKSLQRSSPPGTFLP